MNVDIKYSDYRFKNPPELPQDAANMFMGIQAMKSDKNEAWKLYFDKFRREIYDIEATLHENISNFIFLVERLMIDPENGDAIRLCLDGYLKHPGFYINIEDGKRKWVCNYKKALQVILVSSIDEALEDRHAKHLSKISA